MTNIWPMILDYSTEECSRMLRSLELEAYASVVSALRAQGELTKEKKQILIQLSRILSITCERHQAEIRRAANDEKLNTIAFRICKENTYEDWITEGRRLVPLVPRPVPQTALTSVANAVANLQATKNENLLSSVPQSRASEPVKEAGTTNKRKRAEKNTGEQPPKAKTVHVSNTSSQSCTITSKNHKVITSTRSPTISSAPATLSSLPRVVFMSTSASGLRTLAVTQASASFVTNTTSNNVIADGQIPKARLVSSSLDTSTANTSGTVTAPTAPTSAKVYTTKSFPQQLVVFPGTAQQKAITIPISQPLKIGQTSTTAATLLYQGTPATIKGVPGTFTIQTFKPSQSTGKIQGSNVIIMPAKTAVGQTAKPIATLVASNAKGLTRQISQKEIKVVNSEVGKEEKTMQSSPNRAANANVIEIQTSGAMLQNIMKSGQLNKDIIDLVQKAVKTTSGDSPEAPKDKGSVDPVTSASGP